jgi:cell wall-associated NlpC family hydrolase
VAAVAWAKRQVGLPYKWGGEGPGSYDCSGLTMRAWQRSGVSMPHSSRAQYRQARKVPHSQLRPGDLLFFATDPSDPDTIHHVSMYAGGGLMVEAPSTGLRVRVVPVRPRGAMPWAGRP